MFTFKKNKCKGGRSADLILLILVIPLIVLNSCIAKPVDHQIERSFYYWKSVFTLTRFEKQKLDSLQVKTIYLKFFDVDWNEELKKPKPLATIRITDSAYKNFTIIPTVFITNACIQKIDAGQVKELAQNIMLLVKSIIADHAFKDIAEIQFDCDWTATTKDKYFALLTAFRALKPNAKLSATIRLHQVKFISKSGVPPVDRGLLMCYNMGNLKNPATKNSIIETEELKKYTGSLQDYPLPLDIAMPLFNWQVLYRDNVYTGLIQNLSSAAFDASFTRQTGNRYYLLKDTLLRGYDLRKGDMIRDEQSDIHEVLATAAEISPRLKNTALRVSLYHLDSVILRKYLAHDLESLYNRLH